jgi:hypothetical protein
VTKLFQVYTKTIQTSQTSTQLQLNYPLILTLKTTSDWLKEMENFQFLKTNFIDQSQKLTQLTQLIEFSNLRPTIYFSNSLKDQFKYVFGKNKFTYKSERHKYLKTKTQLLLYKKDHEIKTNYHKKYEEKDLYCAQTLIPEYGSWITL